MSFGNGESDLELVNYLVNKRFNREHQKGRFVSCIHRHDIFTERRHKYQILQGKAEIISLKNILALIIIS